MLTGGPRLQITSSAVWEPTATSSQQIDGEMEEKSMASSRQKEPALSWLGV